MIKVNLLEDSYQKSSKETERLRQHLLQIEEAYTNEAVKSEERETTLRNRLKELEAQLLVQLESNKDGRYTSRFFIFNKVFFILYLRFFKSTTR